MKKYSATTIEMKYSYSYSSSFICTLTRTHEKVLRYNYRDEVCILVLEFHLSVLVLVLVLMKKYSATTIEMKYSYSYSVHLSVLVLILGFIFSVVFYLSTFSVNIWPVSQTEDTMIVYLKCLFRFSARNHDRSQAIGDHQGEGNDLRGLGCARWCAKPNSGHPTSIEG